MKLIHADIVYSEDRTHLAVHPDSYIAVEEGIVKGVWTEIPEEYRNVPLTDYGNAVLIPAFSDLHVHAPQYLNRGLEMDLLLADWLDKCTFPLEAKYADPEFAKLVYDAFVDDMIANGTMHACVYGTIHTEATSYLIERMDRRGIKGFVGKVNMDRNAPDDLLEDPEGSVRRTEELLEKYSGNRNTRPILTPRFAPTCTRELINDLGRLGRKYSVGMQTHLVESIWEAEQARILFPECTCDTEIYERAGLMDNGPVIGGHFIFPSEEDIHIMQKYDSYAVQCPDATVSVIAGIMQTGALLDRGMKIGLGSDISAGHHIGVYTQAARAVQLSKLKQFYEPEGNRKITFPEAFWMATKQSGPLFGGTGSLEPGSVFDALVIDGLSDAARQLTPEQTVERFCYIGTKENIKVRYMNGETIE
ncbi:MAG: amidohydrolase family protein [Mogibacterium sp.]|nr:amidohydrolase family protein [Mogibacterium sp.]